MKSTLLLALIVSFFTTQAQERPKSTPLSNSVPSDGFVIDLEQALNDEEEKFLEDKLRTFERITQSRLLIISIRDIEDFSDFDQYALKLIDELEINEKLGKNGLSLIFSGQLRKIHLNTEMERRKIVEDSVYSRVVNEVVIPAFKDQDYFNGLQEAIHVLLTAYND